MITKSKLYSHKQKQRLIDRIQSLTNNEIYINIIKILHSHNITMVSTDNDITINLSTVSSNICQQIDAMLNEYNCTAPNVAINIA